MKAVCVMLVIALLGCATAFADSMEGVGTASGNVVLWFSGQNVTATFDSTFALSGQLLIADEAIPFSTYGWARGAGNGNSATLDLEAWATFAATGTTEAGEAISVQGGLTLFSLSADAGGSSGSGTGEFFATVFIGEHQYHVLGSAEGTASGSLVIPEDPLSMELAGDGIFNLNGEMSLVSATPEAYASSGEESPGAEPEAAPAMVDLLPWDLETWPEELLAELLDILTRTIDIPAPPEADS